MDKVVKCSLSAWGLILGACVNHTFAPGPGMSADQFEPDSARCRIFAREDAPAFAFSAAGSQQFVESSMAGAAVGHTIGAAVRENQDYNDCMEALGWRVVDGQAHRRDALSSAIR